MFNRLLTSVALFFLPSIDSLLDEVHDVMVRMDKLVVSLDKRLEDQAVRLAKHNQDRREALQAVERTYERRAGQTIDTISSIQSRAKQAAEARDKVASFLAQ